MTTMQLVEQLEKSKEFSAWKKSHSKAYLAHCFKMFDEANKDIWQIGYFNPKTDLITVFVMGKTISRNEDAEVFKDQKKLVQPLLIKDVKITEDEALKKAQTVYDENYKKYTVFKQFMILQNLEEHGQVWNITFVTQEFKTVNVKIDAKTGECKSHKLISLIRGEEE